MKPPYKVGDDIMHDGRLATVTSVVPILTKGSATQKNIEVKIDGWCLGLTNAVWPPEAPRAKVEAMMAELLAEDEERRR